MAETPGSIFARLLTDRDAGKDVSKAKEGFEKATRQHFGNALVNFTFEDKKSNKPVESDRANLCETSGIPGTPCNKDNCNGGCL